MPNWRQFVREHLPQLHLGGAREAQVIEELAHQLEDRYEELRARGVPRSEAQAQAEAQFPEWAELAAEIRTARMPIAERLPEPLRREVQREDLPLALRQGRGRIMGDFLQDIKYALRTAAKQPGFTAVVLLTLAIGIGANTAIFSVLHAVVLKPLPYPEPQQLVMLWQQGTDGRRSNVGYPTFYDWRAQTKSFEAMAAMSFWNPTLSADTGEPESIQGSSVTADYFRVLGVRPLLGREFTQQEDSPNQNSVVILSYSLWKRRFGGDPALVGKQILMNGIARTVVGIMPAGFQSLLSHQNLPAEIWRPLGYQGEQAPACRDCQHLRVVARIRMGVTPQQANAEIDAVYANVRRDHPKDYAEGSVQQEPLHEEFAGDSRETLYLLFGAVASVLLVACANVAGLMLSRAVVRRKELALRAALGAGRARIVRQLLTESLLLALAGGALGVLLAWSGMRALLMLAPTNIPRLNQVSLDPVVLSFAAGAALLTGILFGLVPALSASRLDLQEAMKEGGRGSSGGRTTGLREGLVLADVAIALVLLAGAGLTLRSLVRLLDVDPGFAPQHVLKMDLTVFGPQFYGNDSDQKVQAAYAQILERVRALPGVQSAGAVSMLPLGGDGDMYGLRFKDKPVANPADSPSGDRYCVTPGFIEAMGIRVLRGRSLTEQDHAQAERVVLINETVAQKVWPGEDPLGKFIQMGGPEGPWRKVVGVTGRVRHGGLDEPDRMQFFAPEVQWLFTDTGLTLVARTTADPAALAPTMRQAVWSVNRNVRIDKVMTMENVIGESVASRRFAMGLLSLFAGVAALLAAIGLYGLMAYTVSQRLGEIGIRMALGASPGQMLRWVMQRGMRLAVAGVVLGVFAALALSRAIGQLLFQTKPTDPPTLAATAALLFLVAAVACWIPARRAAHVDPLVALRHE